MMPRRPLLTCLLWLAATGDLVRIGPTGTNVGDLQVLLTGPA